MGNTMVAKAEKLSVSIQKQELEWARAHAEKAGKSLSAVLTEALRDKRRGEAMDRLLKKYGADKISDEAMAAIRAEVYGR
jgi:hypothetical protein